jgi:hypothetical protein
MVVANLVLIGKNNIIDSFMKPMKERLS